MCVYVCVNVWNSTQNRKQLFTDTDGGSQGEIGWRGGQNEHSTPSIHSDRGYCQKIRRSKSKKEKNIVSKLAPFKCGNQYKCRRFFFSENKQKRIHFNMKAIREKSVHTRKWMCVCVWAIFSSFLAMEKWIFVQNGNLTIVSQSRIESCLCSFPTRWGFLPLADNLRISKISTVCKTQQTGMLEYVPCNCVFNMFYNKIKTKKNSNRL